MKKLSANLQSSLVAASVVDVDALVAASTTKQEKQAVSYFDCT